jgi:predicted small lipoprotein YifL
VTGPSNLPSALPAGRRRMIRLGLAAAVLALALGACGKKPGTMQPPEGADTTRFPRTYPNPVYDPAPASRPPSR